MQCDTSHQTPQIYMDTLNVLSLAIQDIDAFNLSSDADWNGFVNDLFIISYQHSNSRRIRRACHNLFERCLERIPTSIKVILDEIHKHSQVSELSTTVASAYVCLEWTSLCLKSGRYDSEDFPRLVKYQALLLDTCCSDRAKRSLTSWARRRVCKTLDSLREKDQDLTMKQKLLYCLTQCSPSAKHAIMIGEAFRVYASQDQKGLDPQCKKKLLDYYIQFFLTARLPAALWSIRGLEPFFESAIDNDDVSKILIPATSRALLRAPEVVADPVLTVFFSSVRRSDDDCTQLLISGLLKPIFGTFNSSNSQTRDAGIKALSALQHRSEKYTDMIIAELVGAYTSDRPGFDFRQAVAASLGRCLLRPPNCPALIKALLPILAKETHEVLQNSLISVFFQALAAICQHGQLQSDTATGALVKGINDKRTQIRNQWLSGLADLVISNQTAIIFLIEALINDLLDVWLSALKAPLQQVQNGSIIGTYAITVIFLSTAKQSCTIGKPCVLYRLKSTDCLRK